MIVISHICMISPNNSLTDNYVGKAIELNTVKLPGSDINLISCATNQTHARIQIMCIGTSARINTHLNHLRFSSFTL